MEKDAYLTIGRPQRHCANCSAAMDEVERHASVIRSLGEERLERQDFCPECWQHVKDEAYDSFWMTRRRPKEAKLPKLSRRERSTALRALFEALWDRRESEDVGAHLYMLAHLLLKWGGLRWVRNELDPQGAEIVVFEDPASGDRIEIRAATVEEERVARIKEEIEAFLREHTAQVEVVL